MTKDEALRLALEALESTGENNGYHGVTQYFDETMVDQAINAIKAALEAKDEPVAWMCADESLINKGYARFSHVCMGEWKIPVYTTPPQRKPLTDEEIERLWPMRPTDDVINFARAIEAAHGIKGEA